MPNPADLQYCARCKEDHYIWQPCPLDHLFTEYCDAGFGEISTHLETHHNLSIDQIIDFSNQELLQLHSALHFPNLIGNLKG